MDPKPGPLGTLISVYGQLGSQSHMIEHLEFNGAQSEAQEPNRLGGSSTVMNGNMAFGMPRTEAMMNAGSEMMHRGGVPLPTADASSNHSSSNGDEVKSKRKGKAVVSREDTSSEGSTAKPASKAKRKESSVDKKDEKKKRARKNKGGRKGSEDGGDSDESQDENDGEDSGEKTRFRWTDELHQYFLACVFEMGLEAASPKKVYLKMMADPQFAKTILDETMFDQMTNPEAARRFGAHHVKSHLQRFRSNIVQPRLAFIKQLCELMQEAKRKKKEEGHKQSKVLNPEYHAYPFAVDRTFPDNMTNSELASVISSGAALLKTSRHAGGPVPPSSLASGGLYASAAASGAASFASPLMGYPNSSGHFPAPPPPPLNLLHQRPRTLSSFEAGEQMRAQVEMRERIESQGQRQVIQATSAASALRSEQDFDTLPAGALMDDDDNLFDWLISREFFPPSTRDEAAAQGQSTSERT